VGIGFFLFQLSFNIVMALPQVDIISKTGLQVTYFVIVLLVMGVSTVFLLIFGVKLRNQLKLYKDIDLKRKKVIRKVSTIVYIV
jgi:predicted membrane metal-binding protein